MQDETTQKSFIFSSTRNRNQNKVSKNQEKSSIPNTERRFNWEAQESTGIPCEDVTDVSPLVCIQQVNVRRVLDALPQVHQAAHQNLDIWEGPEQQSLYNKQNTVSPAGALTWKNILTSTKINLQPWQPGELHSCYFFGWGVASAAWEFASSRFTIFKLTQSTLKNKLCWIQLEVVHLTHMLFIFQNFSLYYPTQQKIADDYSKNIPLHF